MATAESRAKELPEQAYTYCELPFLANE